MCGIEEMVSFVVLLTARPIHHLINKLIMKKWTKKEALNSIQNLIEQIPNIMKTNNSSQEHMRWLANSLRIIEEIFGGNSRYFVTLSHFSWQMSGRTIIQEWDFQQEIEKRNHQAFLTQMAQAEGLLLAAKDHLEQSDIESVYDGKNTANETSELFEIINLGVNKLRKIIRDRPEKEKDVQDKYEDLLIANNILYAREFPHIKYSSKQYIPDFSFQKIELTVEIKLCKKDEKGLIAQLNDDILAYQTAFRNILFIIYDLGQIRDEDVFKSTFEAHKNVYIQIIKH